jgi:hypothetical protein
MGANTSFTEQLDFGAVGEKVVHHLLSSVLPDALFIPFYQFLNSNTVPYLFKDPANHLNSPDIVILNKGTASFAEVKTKDRWVHYYTVNELETGIDANDYDEYQRVSKETGVPVVIYFLHIIQPPFGLYAVKLGADNTRYWDGRSGGNYIQKPMRYWRQSQLKKLPFSDEIFSSYVKPLNSYKA